MQYNVQDVQAFLRCPKRFSLDSNTQSLSTHILYPYLRKCVLFMYSEELCNGYKVHFRRVINQWDRVFWATRENNEETIKLSYKGLEYLKNFHDKVYLKDKRQVAVVDFEYKYNPTESHQISVAFNLMYDIISVDQKDKIHLTCLTDTLGEGYNHPAYDLAIRILHYTLSEHLGKPVHAVHKQRITSAMADKKVIYFKPKDVENIPAILEHVGRGIKAGINVPVFGEECKSCPHYICSY
jgi:hypothetical protein